MDSNLNLSPHHSGRKLLNETASFLAWVDEILWWASAARGKSMRSLVQSAHKGTSKLIKCSSKHGCTGKVSVRVVGHECCGSSPDAILR